MVLGNRPYLALLAMESPQFVWTDLCIELLRLATKESSVIAQYLGTKNFFACERLGWTVNE